MEVVAYVRYRRSDLEDVLLTTPDDTEDALWIVMPGAQFYEADQL
jgi:hypothetical protein